MVDGVGGIRLNYTVEAFFMWFQAETVHLAVLLRKAFIVQLEMSFNFSHGNNVENLRQNISNQLRL